MGSHPVNLALRFALELSVLATLATWGWNRGTGWTAPALAVGLPLVAALMWGTFAVPGDPSRSGGAPNPVPGYLRLALELSMFALATWALYDMGANTMSGTYGAIVVMHYLVSYDRVAWLLKR